MPSSPKNGLTVGVGFHAIVGSSYLILPNICTEYASAELPISFLTVAYDRRPFPFAYLTVSPSTAFLHGHKSRKGKLRLYGRHKVMDRIDYSLVKFNSASAAPFTVLPSVKARS